VPVELEALAFGLALQPVEMLFEIGDPFLGIEVHHFFKIALPRLLHQLPFAPNGGRDKLICAFNPLL